MAYPPLWVEEYPELGTPTTVTIPSRWAPRNRGCSAISSERRLNWDYPACSGIRITKSMENREIALILAETADLMEIAARRFLSHPQLPHWAPRPSRDIRSGWKTLSKTPERKVTDIPGIGKGLAARDPGDPRRRGSLRPARPTARRSTRPTALEFLKIQGLGPKSIALIFEHYRISTIDDLERLCLEQKLRALPRMGAKLEEKVLRSIAQYRQRAGPLPAELRRQIGRRADRLSAELEGVEEDHAGRQPAPGPRNRRRPGPAGDRSAAARRSTASYAPAGAGGARPRAKTRPAPRSAGKGCRWTCGPCRGRATAPPCNTSPAARTTTSRCARAP